MWNTQECDSRMRQFRNFQSAWVTYPKHLYSAREIQKSNFYVDEKNNFCNFFFEIGSRNPFKLFGVVGFV